MEFELRHNAGARKHRELLESRGSDGKRKKKLFLVGDNDDGGDDAVGAGARAGAEFDGVALAPNLTLFSPADLRKLALDERRAERKRVQKSPPHGAASPPLGATDACVSSIFSHSSIAHVHVQVSALSSSSGCLVGARLPAASSAREQPSASAAPALSSSSAAKALIARLQSDANCMQTEAALLDATATLKSLHKVCKIPTSTSTTSMLDGDWVLV